MTRRPTKYDGDVPVFPGMGQFEFFEHAPDDGEGGAGIVIVDDDGIVGELVNPSDKPTRKKWFSKNESLWRFQFGVMSTTNLLVWSRGVEDALELAADWLEKNAPGHLMAADSEELKNLLDEAREELGEDADEGDVEQSATADLTYTEAGYLTSHEWTVDEVGDKKLLEAAHYASDLADYRFHENKNGIDILELRDFDVYLLVNPNTQASAFWSVEGSVSNTGDALRREKAAVVVLASGENHAERQATPVLEGMLGADCAMFADEIKDSEDFYWPLSAISAWVQAKRPGPFELLPAIGTEQTPNARWPYQGTKGRPVQMTRRDQEMLEQGHDHVMKTLRATAQHRADRSGQEISILAPDGHEVEWCTPEPKGQTPNARAQSGGHPIPASKGGGVVVVYIHKDGDWTAVFSGGQWDKEANRGMHQMYGSGDGWTEGNAGSHLGKKTRWEDLPERIRRRVEIQFADDMRANARRRR